MGLIRNYLFFSPCCSSRSWPLRLWLPSTEGYFLFLPFSIPVMIQFSNASHSGHLLFPPRNHFQVTCLGHFQLLSSSPLPTFQWPWEHRPEKHGLCRAQRTVSTTPARQTLLGDRDGWVNGAVGEIFIFKPDSLIPVPRPHPSPWVGKMQRMVDWQDLIPNSCLA